MINKAKALGLAFVAIAAMSALAASAAQASSLHLGANPAVITAHSEAGQEHILSLSATENAKCPTSTLEGTIQTVGGPETQTVEEGTVTATYGPDAAGNPCTFAGVAATVQMNGCQYTLTGAGQPALTFQVDIVNCTSGKQIVIKTATCAINIPAQGPLGTITGTNLGAEKKEVTVNANVINIKATKVGAACPGGPGEVKTASFKGNTIAKAFKDSGTVKVKKHEHEYLEHKCGTQVELLAT